MLNVIKKNILDIITVGVIDFEEKVVEYYPDLRTIYIELDDEYLRFDSINQYSKLQIQSVNEIDFLYEKDEDMNYAKSSIVDIVLVGRDMVGNAIEKMIYYNECLKNKTIICDACEIILKNEKIIFLDPSFLCGISIGGSEKKQYFLENDSYNNF